MIHDTVTTRARAWALTRTDGTVLGFTDHDRDLSFDGITFRAGAGLSASALMQATGLSVDNTEAVGALSDAGLTERDILAGRYDGAALVIHEFDWADPAQRRVLFRGTLGEITRAGGAFRAELRGLSEPLGQSAGRVFGALCPAILGDADCGVALDQPTYRAQCVVERVESAGATLFLPPLPSFAPGWFALGGVRFLTGAAAGLVARVREDRVLAASRRIALWDAPGFLPEAGDTLQIEAGCDKRFATCRTKFVNTANFRGFPHVPTQDWLLASPRGDGSDDGGSLVTG